MSDEYWDGRCGQCGWAGSSEDMGGGMPIADTGDCSELRCPVCGSKDIQDQV